MQTQRSLRRPALIAAGLLALVAVLLLGSFGTVRGLEQRAIDARFHLRGTQHTDQVAVVAIDEHTFSSMGITWPMRRRLHAQMIDRLHAAGVRRIAYDVQFTEPSDHPSDDLALFDAVSNAPGTVLATGESDAKGNTRVLGGDAALAEIGAFAADSTLPSDAGGVIRRYSHDTSGLWSFGTRTAATAGHAPAAKDFQPDGDALIDFRGPAGTIPTYSFADVAAGKVKDSALRGRIVVVGASAPVLQDVHPTSATAKREMPGPEIQANAIWTALHGNPLRELPDWVALLIAGLLGAAGIGLVVRFGPPRAFAISALIVAVYLGATLVAFGQGVVLPVALPLVALATTVAWTAIWFVVGEMFVRAQLARYSEQLERDVEARTAELVESQLDVVLRLAQAAELRDDDTGEHIDRMSTMCGEVAKELGWTDGAAKLLRHASALHDIGKIGVPDGILLKPGRLTEEEFAIMRRHVVHGAELLKGSDAPVLQLAETVARTHHEKWDGTGYPFGLSGDDIPLPGRIAAVCDVFDALTHERPYKRAWTDEEARAELERGRGAHFDTRVVDAMLAVLDRLHGESVLELHRDRDAPKTGDAEPEPATRRAA